MTDNENRAALPRFEPAVKTSETAALMQQARLSVASLGTPEVRSDSPYPSRRSLRSAAPVVVPDVVVSDAAAVVSDAVVPDAVVGSVTDVAAAHVVIGAVADAVVDSAPAAVPPAPGSRRAAREARAAAAALASGMPLAPVVSVAPVLPVALAVPVVPAVPVAPAASVAPVVSVAPSVPVAPHVAAPFGLFGATDSLAAEHTSRRAQRGRDAVARPAGRPAAATAPPAAAASASAPVSRRKRLSAAGTMVLVGGLFVSLTLPPAYASNNYVDELADAPSAVIGAQTLALESTADEVASTIEARDGYDATSAVELRRLYRDALRQQRLEEYAASGAMAMGDDYPWAAELGMGDGGGLSPLNYFVRQCTDFVAWRLNRDAGSTSAPYKYVWSYLTPGAGSARSWKSQWERHGWEVSSTPRPGWVAWFPGGNHVAYVNSVLPNGTVFIEEYNWGPDTYNQRIIPVESALYLAPPPR